MPTSDPRSPASTIGRTLRGAVLGALLSVVFLGVGLLRFCFAGGTPDRAAEELSRSGRQFAFYAAGFALTGAIVAAMRPWLTGRVGTYVRYSVGGAIGMLTIAPGFAGGFATFNAFEWVVFPLLGMIFGCAFARGLHRYDDFQPDEPPAP